MSTINRLLNQYTESKERPTNAETLTFHEVAGKDVYNITAPIHVNNKEIIAGRVEERDSEFSEVYFFEEREKNQWYPIPNAPHYDLQDPFIVQLDGEIIFGGVEVITDGTKAGKIISYRTAFYRGKDIYHLKPFFAGPEGMKDIRLNKLKNGDILVLTRPQGERGGRGKIGYFILHELADLTMEHILNAPLLADLNGDDEWVGANAIYELEASHEVGILGHIAHFQENGERGYYAITFLLNPYTGEHRHEQIIASRADFLPSPAKRDDLKNVIFSGGMKFLQQGKVELYVGVSDACAQRAVIDNPFHS